MKTILTFRLKKHFRNLTILSVVTAFNIGGLQAQHSRGGQQGGRNEGIQRQARTREQAIHQQPGGFNRAPSAAGNPAIRNRDFTSRVPSTIRNPGNPTTGRGREYARQENSFSRPNNFNRPGYSRNPIGPNTYNRRDYSRTNTYNRPGNNAFNNRGYDRYNSYRRPAYNPRNPNWCYAYAPRRNTIFNTLPSSYININFGGFGYRYYDGIFYRPYNRSFRVIAPPVGIFINVLPFGYSRIYVHDYPYYYYNGVYYDHRADNYVVVSPPVGALVESLPDGYETVIMDGETYYTVDGAQYKPVVQDNGEIWYEVIKSSAS